MIVICFSKLLIDRKPDNIKLNVIPKTNEEYISVLTYGCLGFVDSLIDFYEIHWII